jgi:hypothetical protein
MKTATLRTADKLADHDNITSRLAKAIEKHKKHKKYIRIKKASD